MSASAVRPFVSGVFIAFLAAAGTWSAASAHAQSTTIELNYGGSGPCLFEAPNGFTVNGQTGTTSATGTFDATSDCPQGNGSTTGPAAVTLTPASATPTAGTPVTLNWTGVGDVCRYDGSSLPVPVTGWPASGEACIGASECAAAHSLVFTPSTSGTYNFKLTCTTGAQPPVTPTRSSLSKTAVITVSGGTPPVGQCVAAPAGATQQTTATVQNISGFPKHTNGAATTWGDVFGYDWSLGNNAPKHDWPGVAAIGSTMFVDSGKYLALQFKVPNTFPLTPPGGSWPVGGFATNATGTEGGVTWTVSITPDCGNFNRPALASDPQYACYAEYAVGTSYALKWVVTTPTTRIANVCNLDLGGNYYLNIIPASISQPATSNCTGTSCKIALQQMPSFPSGPVSQ